MSPAQEQRIVSVLDALLVELRSIYATDGGHDQQPEPEAPPSPLMTPEEVAAMIQINVRTLRRIRLAGEMPEPLQFGTRVRWRRADIETWIAERKN